MQKGPEVDWDPATQTAIITQEPLATDEATEVSADEAKALNRYTRALAYTHLPEILYCSWGVPMRVEDFTYLFAVDTA